MRRVISTGSSRFNYLLACKHTGHTEIESLNLSMVCPVCHVYRKLLAVECREWHVHCDNCRYGKWHGQSETEARNNQNRHARNTSHNIHCDYQVYQNSKDRIQKLFGRKVRKYIENEFKFLPDNIIKLTSIQLEYGDECPF